MGVVKVYFFSLIVLNNENDQESKVAIIGSLSSIERDR